MKQIQKQNFAICSPYAWRVERLLMASSTNQAETFIFYFSIFTNLVEI